MTLGIATAAGSLGQVIGAPAAEYLMLCIAWQSVFLIFAGVIIASLLALPFIRSPRLATRSELEESLGTIAAAVFFLMPVTPASVLVFSAVMGSLWLATVPLTSGLVAHIYGVRHMGTLYGFVFLSHQIGGFLGAWLGGAMYDVTGGYALVWWIGVGVGAFPAIVHLPIREARPLAQPA